MPSDLEKVGNALEPITKGDLIHIEDLGEAVHTAEGVIAAMKDKLKEVEQEYKEQMIRIIKEKGPFQLGSFKYVIGTKKTDRQGNPIAILNAISDATGGDFEKIVGCLKSSAFKPGESKRILKESAATQIEEDEEFTIDIKSLFWVEEDDDLKRTELKKINTTFLK